MSEMTWQPGRRAVVRLTNSEASMFRECRRKWWLTYFRGLHRRERTLYDSPLTIGTRVHDALAAYYQTDQVLRQHPVEYALAIAAKEIEEHPTAEAGIKKEMDLVTTMLEGYLEWLAESGDDEDLVVLAPETKMEIALGEGATLLSKIDARVQRRSTGTRLALEHKTVAGMNDLLPTAQIDTQFLTEHLVEYVDLLEKGRAGESAEGVLLNMLRKVKRTARATPPFYGREAVMHNVHELRSHWRHVVAIAREIQWAEARLEAGEDHHTVAPPSPSRDCSWKCPFVGVCPLFDDGSDVEAALLAEYEAGDPLERYEGTSTYEEVS